MNESEHEPEYYKWLKQQIRIRARAIKWNQEHRAEVSERNRKYNQAHKVEIKEYHRLLYRTSHPLKPREVNVKPSKEVKVKPSKEPKRKPVKESIKLKFGEMNQNIERFNKSFESISIDNLAKAIDEYMSTHNMIKLEMNNKLWAFLKDKFGKELTEHRYRFLLSALKKRLI